MQIQKIKEQTNTNPQNKDQTSSVDHGTITNHMQRPNTVYMICTSVQVQMIMQYSLTREFIPASCVCFVLVR